MGDLYLTRIQPNPPGKDAGVGALQLNNEWLEFEIAAATRNLSNDLVTHNTYTERGCTLTGTDALFKFGSLTLTRGQRVRIHSGSGTAWWEGQTLHVYAGRSWYVWNNRCGDRASISFNGQAIDWAQYSGSPREGILSRVPGTNQFV